MLAVTWIVGLCVLTSGAGSPNGDSPFLFTLPDPGKTTTPDNTYVPDGGLVVPIDGNDPTSTLGPTPPTTSNPTPSLGGTPTAGQGPHNTPVGAGTASPGGGSSGGGDNPAGGLPNLPNSLHVTVGGSSSGSCASDDPCDSISRALSLARPGDTVYVHAGTYTADETVVPAAGRVGSRIRLTPWPGDHPVHMGRFWVESAEYLTIDGMKFTWRDGMSADDHLVKMKGGIGWTIANSEISGARSYADLFIGDDSRGDGPDNWTITKSCIHDNYGSSKHDPTQDHLIYLGDALSASGGVIEYNTLFGAPHGRGIKLGGASTSGGMAGVTIRHNTIVDTGKASISVSGKSTGNTFTGNLLVSAGDGGIAAFQLSGKGNTASGNAMYDTGGVTVHQDGPASVGGSGNVLLATAPGFASQTCSGLAPTSRTAQSYGR